MTGRWAVGTQLRDMACGFADDSRRASPWAARLYDDTIARGKDRPTLGRILARACRGTPSQVAEPSTAGSLQQETRGC